MEQDRVKVRYVGGHLDGTTATPYASWVLSPHINGTRLDYDDDGEPVWYRWNQTVTDDGEHLFEVFYPHNKDLLALLCVLCPANESGAPTNVGIVHLADRMGWTHEQVIAAYGDLPGVTLVGTLQRPVSLQIDRLAYDIASEDSER